MKPLVIIPARGGSKGIPGKNSKELRDKPLIAYTIDAARAVFKDEEICVSTDDRKIIDLVEKDGLIVPFIRPPDLAIDTASTYDVLRHALHFYEINRYVPEVVILLQPTSPFRTHDHIKEALKLYHDDLDMVVSVKETTSNPYYTLFEENSEGFLVKSKKGTYSRRQDCPSVWEYNGAIYIINPTSLKKTSHLKFQKIIKYEMNEESSLDLDSPLDWKLAEYILEERNQ